MTVISTVAPIFALICIGYVAGRSGLVSDQATKGLSEFTFTLAIPAMLFRKMATATLPDAAPLAILSAYLVIGASIWCASYVVARHFLARSPLDSVSIAKSSVFGNVVMLGIPLSLAAFGEAAAAPIAIIIAAHSPVLWLASAIQLAWVKRQQQVLSAPTVARDLAAVLLKNAIILAVLAGTLWQRTGIGLPPLIDKVLILLGSAGIPCALVALGLSLVRFRIAGQTPTLTMILCLKLIAMPIFAYWVAAHIFALDPVSVGVVTIFAAMPTGVNAYLFAAQHSIAQHSASGAVALGTILAAPTASLVIYLLKT